MLIMMAFVTLTIFAQDQMTLSILMVTEHRMVVTIVIHQALLVLSLIHI